ncbi:MAG: hypothetical protein EBV17_05695, partial [Actinobacteria bacterium]|nr:hypothetical protein [Actinomycetota bacterium]
MHSRYQPSRVVSHSASRSHGIGRRESSPQVAPPIPNSSPIHTIGTPVAAMRAFTAGVPFDAVLRSWLILDSHDTPRFNVLTGSRDRTKVGVGLQMTLPGVPMVWMGDELGIGGATCGEDSRRPMPWDREAE